MPLATAQSLGWNLSRTLMTVIVLIETNHGYFVIPADEFDGDDEQVVREYDPLSRCPPAPFAYSACSLPCSSRPEDCAEALVGSSTRQHNTIPHFLFAGGSSRWAKRWLG